MVEPEASQTFGIRKETLKCVVSDKHRNEIAKRVGDAWESLATFIGVSNVDVDDIKEKYVQPLDRRLAMMRRWHELWGSEATYQRLVEGLRQIGRRDLIEFLKQKTQLPSASGLKLLLKHQNHDSLRFCWISQKAMCTSLILILILVIFFCGIDVPIKYNHNNYKSIL